MLGPRQAHITDLQITIRVEEQVCGFDITVNNRGSLGVQPVQGLQELLAVAHKVSITIVRASANHIAE